jgi:hypothetical protein
MAGELVAALAMTVQTGALSANKPLWYIISHDPGRRSPQHSNYPPGVSLSAATAHSYAGTPHFSNRRLIAHLIS